MEHHGRSYTVMYHYGSTLLDLYPYDVPQHLTTGSPCIQELAHQICEFVMGVGQGTIHLDSPQQMKDGKITDIYHVSEHLFI